MPATPGTSPAAEIGHNPLLFGYKGSVFLSRLTCRLFDGTVEVARGFRSLTRHIAAIDRFYYGFTPEELMPGSRISA